MLTLINKTDYTSNVPYDSIQISSVAGDQAGQAQFQVIDPGSAINLQLMQEVIFIDENAVYGNATTAMTPGHNYINNGSFTDGNSAWSVVGNFTSRITFPSNPTFVNPVATMTFSNQVVGFVLAGQNIVNPGSSGYNYVVPGQTYCLSGTINVTSGFTNSYAMLKISFFDVAGNSLASQESTHLTALGSQRISVSLVAPAGAVNVRPEFGGVTTNTTNSGTATFAQLQCESVWFPSLYSYPTPIMDKMQPDCVFMINDGSVMRYDRIFCGNITDLVASYEGTTRTWDVTVTSLDGWLENSNLLTKSYTNATDQSMIIDALGPVPIHTEGPDFAQNTPQALAYRNMSFCYVGITTTMDFADATPREVFNSVTDISGFLFGVDPYYNAYYHPRYYNAAPYAFSSSPDNVATFPYYDYSIEYDGSQLQNIINVTGNTYVLSVTETWNAQDGSHTEFTSSGNTFAFIPLHTPNAIDGMSLTIGGTAQTCNLNTGQTINTNIALIDLNYPLVQIDPYASPGTAIVFTYNYTALVYVQTQSPDSIAEFGRPLYAKINDTNLATNASAATRGEAQLIAYAQPLTTIKFKTTKMLSVGQVITFTSALDGITNGHYAVQKVTATYLGNGINQYEVEAGTYIDDLIDFFRNTQKATNRADHSTTEPFKLYSNLQQDSLSVSDSLNIHT
jgi:hypothetical protein